MSDSPAPQIIISLGTLIIGSILVYKFWTHGEPQQIKGLVSQDSRSEIIFDSEVAGQTTTPTPKEPKTQNSQPEIFDTETTGQLVTTLPDGSKATEPIQVKYSHTSGQYRIETLKHRVFTLSTDKRGPLGFYCMECAASLWQPQLDTLWWAKQTSVGKALK